MITQSTKLGAAMDWEHWCSMANIETFYIDEGWLDRPMFVTDLTFCANNVALLFIEVTISQSRQDVDLESKIT
jgi:hypothetical protein